MFNSFSADGPLRRMQQRRALRSQSTAPIDFNGLGTLANPGIASPLGPTLSMKTGAFLHPLLQAAKDKFPKDNPRGRWLGEMLLGDPTQRTGRMAQGIPYQYTGRGPLYARAFRNFSEPVIRPQVMDLAGALPIASTLTLAKAALPVAKAAAVPAGMVAASRAVEPLLGIAASDNIPNNLVQNIPEVLLGARVAADPNMSVAMTAPTGGLLSPPERFADFRARDELGFRSVVSDVISLDTFPNSGTAEQMEAALGQKGGLSNQVREQIGNRRIDKEELKFLGITDLLEEAKRTGQPVTKEQIKESIEFNRETMDFREEVLEEVDEISHHYLEDDPISYEDSYGPEFIAEEIDRELTENDFFAERLADNPDNEEAIREQIYEILETGYNDDPVRRIRLYDDDGTDTEIYAIGNDGMGWEIRRGGDNWDNSETLTTGGNFVDQQPLRLGTEAPMNMHSEHEAGVQLQRLGDELRDDFVPPDGKAKHRDLVVEDRSMGDIGEVQNYREIIVREPELAGGNIGSHYGDDAAYHMRVSDRNYYPGMTRSDQSISNSTREAALYVDEIQSDYAQSGAGRKWSFNQEEKEILSNVDMDKKELKLALSTFDTSEAKQARNNLLVKLGDMEARNRSLAQQGEIHPLISVVESAPLTNYCRN